MKHSLVLCITVVAMAMGIAPANSQTLIDYYMFENDGVDSQGGDADGSVGAAVMFTNAALGMGAQFGTDGSGAANRINVPQANAFNPGAGDFSMAFWAQRNDVDTGTSDGIFDALSGTTTGYQAQFVATGEARLRLDDQAGGENSLIDSTQMITDSELHHFAFTVDRTGEEARVYVDGALDNVVDLSGDNLVGTISPSQDLQIGTLNNAQGMEGVLDELRFYDGVLSADEVLALATVSIPEPASIAIWSLIGLGLAGFGCRRFRRRK